jgi:hypothetical protein
MIDVIGRGDVVDRAQGLLAQSPQADLHQLRVDRRGQVLMLRGRVRSYYLKQLAQETVRAAATGLVLDNRVAVEP